MDVGELLNNNYMKNEPSSPNPPNGTNYILPRMETVYPRNDMLAMQNNYHPRTKAAKGTSPVFGGNPPRTDVITAGTPSGNSDSMMNYGYGMSGLSAHEIHSNGNHNPYGYGAMDLGNKPKVRRTGTAPPGMGKRSHLPKRYKCAMCAYRTRYKSDLNRHVRKHAVASFNCDICNMPFKTVGNVEFHKRKEHSNSEVHQLSDFKQETPMMYGAMKYNCNRCPYGTMHDSYLARHLKKHEDARCHCDICNRPFSTSGSLINHKRTVHNIGATEETPQEYILDDDDIPPEETNYDGSTNQESAYIETNGETQGERVVFVDGEEDSNEADEESKQLEGNENIIETVGNDGMKYRKGNADLKILSKNDSSNINTDPATKDLDDKHECKLCRKKFSRKIVLDIHMRNIHNVPFGRDDGMFKEQNYELALDLSIQEMETVRDGGSGAINFKKRHQCPYCAYSTPYKSTYDRHVKKHEQTCHACPTCRMPFVTIGHLQHHIRECHSPMQQLKANSIDSRTQLMMAQQDNLRHVTMGQGAAHETTKRRSNEEKRMNQQEHMDVSSVISGKASDSNISPLPPASGRYAKLVSDFDDFSAKPFACALCFYRTNDTKDLFKHVENHVTGCNVKPIPESALMSFNRGNPETESETRYLPPILPIFNVPNTSSSPTLPNSGKQSPKEEEICSESTKDIPIKNEVSGKESADDMNMPIADQNNNGSEEPQENSRIEKKLLSPSYSVHYRRDSSKLRPYLCLLCRRRFRLLVAVKQHFKQAHPVLNKGDVKDYACSKCDSVYNNPILLQEHHDRLHR